MHKLKPILLFSGLLLVLSCCTEETNDLSQSNTSGEWLHHGADHFSSKYAALDQINPQNFEQLEVAWRWESADNRIPETMLYPTGDYRATPLVVNGIMYTNTNHGQVVALNPTTGEELWYT